MKLAKVSLILLAAVGSVQAIPVTYTFNNCSPSNSSNCNPPIIGDPNKFWIQDVLVTVDTQVAKTVKVQVNTNYNDGAGNLNPFQVGGKTLQLGDFFFTEGGTAAFGIPLVSRANDITGNGGGPYVGSSLSATSLYDITNVATGVLTSNQAMGDILPTHNFDFHNNVDVLLYNNGGIKTDSAAVTRQTPAQVGNGLTTGYWQFNFSIDLTTASAAFNQLINSNAWGIQFASADCANDYLTGSVPEPATYAMIGLALACAGLGRRFFRRSH